MLSTVFTPFFILLLVSQSTSSDDRPVVTLKNGPVQGKIQRSFSGKLYRSFEGIPYAKPPIGELRFKDPQPAEKWLGTIIADQPGPECLQYNHWFQKSPLNPLGSEDCLHINVFTPDAKRLNSSKELLDVVVYIHGGAFMFLSSKHFRPQFLLDKDIVFVHCNYRLGILGFLSSGDDAMPGNFGLKDQQLALKWVQENIEAFGGDPKKVTLTGVSAGGVSVHYQILSHNSKGLFHRAISLSGSALVPWANSESAAKRAVSLAEKVGCPTDNTAEMADCLRTRPGGTLVSLTAAFLPWLYIPFTPFGPVIEREGPNSFIHETPAKIIKEKKFSDVPWLVSFDADEGLYPGAEIICKPDNFKKLQDETDLLLPHILDFNDTAPEDKKGEILKKIHSEYFKEKHITANETIELIGDRTYVAGIVEAATSQAEVMSSNLYAYRFAYRGTNSGSDMFCSPGTDFGVAHADDSGYILSTSLNVPSSQEDIKMVHRMVNMWYTFAKTGKPEFVNDAEWPALKKSLPKFGYLNILSPTSAHFAESSSFGRVSFWKSLGLQENTI